MRQILLIITLLILMVVTGCAKNSQEGYNVLFSNVAMLNDSIVYHRGAPIGEILDREEKNGISRVKISIDEHYRQLLTESAAFYVAAGRMNLGRISNYGEPLESGSVICGFSTASSLRWFRIKNILGNANMAAAMRADQLSAFFAPAI